jgi:hypothetical protein
MCVCIVAIVCGLSNDETNLALLSFRCAVVCRLHWLGCFSAVLRPRSVAGRAIVWSCGQTGETPAPETYPIASRGVAAAGMISWVSMGHV